jgi:hypothetical protein
MATLLVNCDPSVGGWYTAIANTDIVYPFAGATVEAQAVGVQQFANGMAAGADALAAGLDQILVFDPVVIDAGELLEQLFTTTDMLALIDDVVFTAVEGVLLDAIEEAGEALLAAIV